MRSPACQIRRYRKADTDRAARRGNNGRIDADNLAVEIEQRATRIAAINRGVSLDEAVIGAGINVAVNRRDDPGRQ